MWEYPDRIPNFALKSIETWQRHLSHCRGPVLINDTNVKEWIPDIPGEYFRLPYTAAKSDAIRYALVYHHGGIYLDDDILIAKNLSKLTSQLASHDLVTYASEGQDCRGSFSSNFMGGRKGSRYLGSVWERQKKALASHCPESDAKKEIVCCFDNPELQCHIPWTQLGEGIAHPVLKGMSPVSTYCFKDEESFVPPNWGTVLTEHRQIDDAMSFWAAKGVKNAMNRSGYHLFNSVTGLSGLNNSQLTDPNTVVGALYNWSLSD